MSRTVRSGLAALAALAALGLSACGDDGGGTIPAADAEDLLAALGEVEQSVAADDCVSAETDATQFVGLVNELPAEVGADTKEDLRAAGQNLVEQTRDSGQCGAAEETPTTTETGATGEFGAE